MNNWWNILESILTLVLGGGLLVSLATLRATKRKADIEVESLKKDNRQKDMDLAKEYVEEFRANVVQPLEKEVKGLRRNIKNLTHAIQKSSECTYSNECPVRNELQKQQSNEDKCTQSAE